MNIEKEIFKKMKLDKNSLILYGFIKENNEFKFSKKIMNDSLRVDVYIDINGNIKGKVFDLKTEEEYTNFRIENIIGEFVNKVKEEYINVLQDIADNCFVKEYFAFEQTNRIQKSIRYKYNVEPEFLWERVPNYGVFRNQKSKKWFGIVMNVDKSKIDKSSAGEIELLNVKLDNDVQKCLKIDGIYPAYHLNKKNWVSIILDDTLSDKEILKLIDISYNLSEVKR